MLGPVVFGVLSLSLMVSLHVFGGGPGDGHMVFGNLRPVIGAVIFTQSRCTRKPRASYNQ